MRPWNWQHSRWYPLRKMCQLIFTISFYRWHSVFGVRKRSWGSEMIEKISLLFFVSENRQKSGFPKYNHILFQNFLFSLNNFVILTVLLFLHKFERFLRSCLHGKLQQLKNFDVFEFISALQFIYLNARLYSQCLFIKLFL